MRRRFRHLAPDLTAGWRLAAAAFVLWLTAGCYVVRSGLHHNDLFNSRRPVEDVIADPETSVGTRDQLAYVEQVLRFAARAGLNTEGAYRYFIQNDRGAVSYIVQAAYPDRLKSVTWWFPVVGRVPYLGYFDKADRDAKAAALRGEGFDIDLGEAGAFSSLGWFDDPIFSSMLMRRRESDVAHLFLHELVHRTVWVPGSTAFNEQLAEYAAEQLTIDFLKENEAIPSLQSYLAKRADRERFYAWLQELRSTLETLYAQRGSLSIERILSDKAAIFERFQQPPLRPQFRVVDYVRAGAPWNNAAVLASVLYAPNVGKFAKARGCVGKDATIGQFLLALRARVRDFRDVADPNLVLDRLCRSPYSARADR